MTVHHVMSEFAERYTQEEVIPLGQIADIPAEAGIRRLSNKPPVWWINNLLSEAECEALMALGIGKVAPSKVLDRNSGDPAQKDYRTSSHLFLPLYCDETVKTVEDRIAALLGIPFIYGEGLQILNYRVQQEYKPHFDFFYPDRPSGAKALQVSGQRVLTLLMYLNSVEEGGETEFPEIGLKVRPEQGSALLFFNVDFTNRPDYKTLHASIPVIRGEKWVATKWMYERHCFESTDPAAG